MVLARGRPDQLERDLRFEGGVCDLGDERDILAGGQTRYEIVELEDETNVMASVEREFAFARMREIVIAVAHRARARGIETAQDIEQRGFAAAGCAEQHHELAAVQHNIDPAQRQHVDLPHAVHLGDPRRLEHDGVFQRPA
jgi:hypothetical protein